MNTLHARFFGFLMVLLLLGGCGQDDKEAIIGIWHVTEANVSGRDIGDGKGYFHFKKDGSVVARATVGIHREGKWTMDPEKKQLKVTSELGSGRDYTYTLEGDNLTMNTTIEFSSPLVVTAHRVDQLPVTPEADTILPPPVQPKFD